MDADLDTLCITVYCMADDLLPAKARNHRRSVSDAELITLAVAQAIMGIPSDGRFLAVARKRLRHLFPKLPKRPGYWKRRDRLADQIEALVDLFARECPGYSDPVVLLDSTPVECGRSRQSVERSELADAAGYGYCRSHSRYFWGMRFHGCFGLDGTPRGAILWSADRPEREVAAELLPRVVRGGEAVVCDKGYAGADFEAAVAELGALVVRPARKDEPPTGFRLSAIRQRIESVCAINPRDAVTIFLRRASGRRLGSEAKKIRTNGAEVVLIQPTGDDLEAMGPNLMRSANRNRVIEVARRTVAEQLREPRNRELLADLPKGDPRRVRRPEGPPSEWPDWRDQFRSPPVAG